MNKKIVNLGIAITLAALVVIMFQDFLKSTVEKYRQELLKKDRVSVVVAATDIYKGTKITSHHVRLKSLPRDLAEIGAFWSVDSAIGKIAVKDILEGEQITTSKVLLEHRQNRFSNLTPPGKRAVTIPVDKISSINGMIKPGDNVDIIGIFPFKSGKETQNVVVPMFEKVKVLAVDQDFNPSMAKKTNIPSTLTLALTPEQAELLTYSLEIGKIRMLLRSPADESITNKEFITINKLWEKLMNIKSAPRQPPPSAPPPTVEIYRGSKKEAEVIQK